MEAFAELVSLVGPPTKAPPLTDWARIEREVGLVFPPDFKRWVSLYVEVKINDFLYIHHPGLYPERSERKDVLSHLDGLRALGGESESIDLMDESGESRRIRTFPLYPEPSGLYPLGDTDNGDYILWLTDPVAENWTVVVTDGRDWWHFRGNFTRFLVALLKKDVHCLVFPDSFPDGTDIEEYARADLDEIQIFYGE